MSDTRSPIDLPSLEYAGRAVLTIYREMAQEPEFRADVQAIILTLAERCGWAGVTLPSGDLGFPLWLPGASELTPEQRRQAWETDVQRCHPLLLAEAWAQLWSRLPPKQRQGTRPLPGLEGAEGADGAEAPDEW